MKNIKAVLIILILALAPMAHGSQTRELEWQCLTIAKREYPADFNMQKFVYEMQLKAARYMLKVPNSDLKAIALREYPEDFNMQKFVYEMQLKAARYMSTVPDSDVKAIALREYPEDFNMQKFVYEMQLKAKAQMESIATH